MADRHYFSYWLTVKPQHWNKDENAKFLASMKAHDCIWPEGPLVMKIDSMEGEISGEVNPDSGSVMEDIELLDNLAKVAAEFPDFNIEIKEMDEEDKSVERTTWFEKGQKVREGYARVVPSDKQYDEHTVRAAADWLRMQLQGRLAKQLEAIMLDK